MLAWVKYAAIYCAAVAASRGAPATAKHTAEQYTLLAIIGLLDVFAFAANVAGIAMCGATAAALILAGAQQLFTAAMSYFLLGRKLNMQQITGVGSLWHFFVAAQYAAATPRHLLLTAAECWCPVLHNRSVCQ